MEINYVRVGRGKPLLLVHGLGGHWRSWTTLLGPLGAQRELIAIDLPGFGETPPLSGEVSIAALADAVVDFLEANGLIGIDAVGSSMGARLVLELARREKVGAVVSLDPGGFWSGWQRHFFFLSIAASIRVLRLLRPMLPPISRSMIGRTLLLSQFSACPLRLHPDIVLDELQSYVAARSFDALLKSLAYGPEQEGMPRGSAKAPIVIGWGRKDRVSFPNQAKRAIELFPDATLHWFEGCGHFPYWDQPKETVDLILETTRER